MNDIQIVWDLPDEPDSNYRRIVKDRGFTLEDIEAVFLDPDGWDAISPNSLPAVFGDTPAGRYIRIPYQVLATSPLTVYPVDAFEVSSP